MRTSEKVATKEFKSSVWRNRANDQILLIEPKDTPNVLITQEMTSVLGALCQEPGTNVMTMMVVMLMVMMLMVMLCIYKIVFHIFYSFNIFTQILLTLSMI